MAPKDELRRTPTIRLWAIGEPELSRAQRKERGMAEVSLEVPGELVGTVRESVLLLYSSSAEALHLALAAHAERRVPLDEVRRQRVRLARLDALLDQLGGCASEPGGGVELSATAELLHDAFYGALLDAGERLGIACGASWRDKRSGDEIADAARSVIALDALLRRVGE
jgi:hypothetical protein